MSVVKECNSLIQQYTSLFPPLVVFLCVTFSRAPPIFHKSLLPLLSLVYLYLYYIYLLISAQLIKPSYRDYHNLSLVHHFCLPPCCCDRPPETAQDFIYFWLSSFSLCPFGFGGQMMASFQKQYASFWPGWKGARWIAATPTTSTPWSSPPTVTSAGWPPRRVSTRRRWKRPKRSSRPLWRASWANVSPASVFCKQKRMFFVLSNAYSGKRKRFVYSLLLEHTGAVKR